MIPTMIPHTCHVTVSSDALFQEIKGEAVLLDLAKETYFGLDEVATFVWRQLQHNPNLRAACDAVLAVYNVEPQQLEADVVHFIRRLVDEGLVQVTPPLDPPDNPIEPHRSQAAR